MNQNRIDCVLVSAIVISIEYRLYRNDIDHAQYYNSNNSK